MKCSECKADIRTPRRREFSRLRLEYLVCDQCGKAQRIESKIKAIGRGKRAAEREQLRAKIALSLPRYRFKILVWGPAPGSSNPAAEKRKQIRSELIKNGHEAYYSEQLGIVGMPSIVLELFQTKKINLVINVDHSPGSAAEFETMGVQLGPNMLLWFPQIAIGGFADSGSKRLFRAAGGFDETFRDDDLASCVLTLASADWVDEKKYLQMYIDEMKKGLERVAPL